MKGGFKILLAAIIFAAFFSQKKVCEHFGIGQPQYHKELTELKQAPTPVMAAEVVEEAPLVAENNDDNLWRWDDQISAWVPDEEIQETKAVLTSYSPAKTASAGPIEIEWNVLMNIKYKLQYFEELGMEMYAPVFGEEQLALDGKEVIIQGFIIPLDESEELLSLSANPYASCFFCGKASPASIISMYMKKKNKRYKMDDFKRFRGTLSLNADNPNEFYYILRDAREE